MIPLPEGEGLSLGERSDPQGERVRGSALTASYPNPSPFRANPLASLSGAQALSLWERDR
jgi:tRNA(Ile)-lysidine synthase